MEYHSSNQLPEYVHVTEGPISAYVSVYLLYELKVRDRLVPIAESHGGYDIESEGLIVSLNWSASKRVV
jgi:hypothetical protein